MYVNVVCFLMTDYLLTAFTIALKIYAKIILRREKHYIISNIKFFSVSVLPKLFMLTENKMHKE